MIMCKPQYLKIRIEQSDKRGRFYYVCSTTDYKTISEALTEYCQLTGIHRSRVRGDFVEYDANA